MKWTKEIKKKYEKNRAKKKWQNIRNPYLKKKKKKMTKYKESLS